jgi:hypothetical protein
MSRRAGTTVIASLCGSKLETLAWGAHGNGSVEGCESFGLVPSEVIGLQTVNAVDDGSAPPVQRSKPDQTVAGREAEIDPPAFYGAI